MSTSDEDAAAGSSPMDAAWYDGVSGWLPLSRAFIDRELGTPQPDFRSFAERLALCPPAERHAGWIGVAQSAPSRMGRTRAYVEALYNDPDPTSVAWSWLDGDFDLMERVEHVLSPDDEHTPAMVETVRNRIGSIVDFGGNDMTAEQSGGGSVAGAQVEQPPAAAAEVAAEDAAEVAAEDVTIAQVEQPPAAAAEGVAIAQAEADTQPAAAAEDVAIAQAEADTQPAAAAEDVAIAQAEAEPQPALEAYPAEFGVERLVVVEPVAQAPVPVLWSPTHFVPTGGMAAWDYPDPSRPPRVILSEGLDLVVDDVAGEWALVRAVNGWRGWVDGRRLTTRR